MLSFLTSLQNSEQNSCDIQPFREGDINKFPQPVSPFPESRKIETEQNLVDSFESTLKEKLGSDKTI